MSLSLGCHVLWCVQMLGEVVHSDQEVRKLEKKLLSLLCSSRHDDYWRLAQKVASTVAARKEVREMEE